MTSQSALLLNEGNIFLINQDYEAAEIRFNSAIELLENSDANKNESDQTCVPPTCASYLFRALSHRSAARLSIASKTADALTDARSALRFLEEIDPSNDTTNLIPGEVAMAHARSGMALYKLEEYVEAKDAFSYAVKIGNGGSSVDWSSWVLRCEEMTKKKVGSQKTTGNVIPAPSAAVPPARTSTVSKKTSPPVCPKYQYYQNDTFLTIAILQPNVESQDLKVDILRDKLTVLLKKDAVEFTVICGTLFGEVEVPKCKVKITDEKVLIKLRKKINKYAWYELFGSGVPDKDNKTNQKDSSSKNDKQGDDADTQKLAPKPIPRIDPQTSVSRPYASSRDWNAIERNLKEDEENDKEGEPLNNLFKEIYGKGDEATRRAMIKSYQTSGGTVLSTNWDEVAKKDYEKERDCPKGMEWKDWEGNKLLPQKD